MAAVSHQPIQGEVASGPGRYRRVPLDRVLVTERDDLFVMVGLETRIEVRAPSVNACADAFLSAFYLFATRLGEGERPSFATSDDEFTELRRVVGKRLMDVVAAVPSDGELVEITSQFYEGGCPPGGQPCADAYGWRSPLLTTRKARSIRRRNMDYVRSSQE